MLPLALILSVLCLFVVVSAEPHFSLYAHTAKDSAIHTRIIWSCDWSPDGAYFVTCSRDKKVIVWGRLDAEHPVHPEIKPRSSILDVGDSATAVEFCPVFSSANSYLVAVGLECGRILLYKWTSGLDPAAWICCGQTNTLQSHCLAVKRLRWRPRVGRAGRDNCSGVMKEEKKNGQTDSESQTDESSWLQLASASSDHSVKIFNVNKQAL